MGPESVTDINPSKEDAMPQINFDFSAIDGSEYTIDLRTGETVEDRRAADGSSAANAIGEAVMREVARRLAERRARRR
jgi:hypothetical protein